MALHDEVTQTSYTHRLLPSSPRTRLADRDRSESIVALHLLHFVAVGPKINQVAC